MAEKDKVYKTPDLAKMYSRSREMPTIWNFRFLRVRRGSPSMDLGPYVESIDWSDDGQYGAGSLSMVKAEVGRNWFPVTKGDMVRVDAEYKGRWHQLVTMRVDGFPSSDTGSGGLSVELKDDLSLLTVQKRDWRYRKTRQRGRGWYPGEIARDIAKKEGLRVGNIFRGAHRIDKLEKKDTYGLDVIAEAYKRETLQDGRALPGADPQQQAGDPAVGAAGVHLRGRGVDRVLVGGTLGAREPGDGVDRQGPRRQGRQGAAR